MKITEPSKFKSLVEGKFMDGKGNPITFTDGQWELFLSLVSDQYDRVVIKAVTQYGKSLITSLALIYLAASSQKQMLIIAPRFSQARIIMSYVIDHIFDNDRFIKQIELKGSLERFKRERSKSRIDWKTGAQIAIHSAHASSSKQGKEKLMGLGGDMVIVDESSLIPDELFTHILRMVGGVENGKLVQLGNPFYKNHFWKAFQDPNYKRITIDYKQAIEEGRMTEKFIEETKRTISPRKFKVLYECEFPDQKEDALIPWSKIQEAVNRDIKNPSGKRQFGGDVARKGDDSTVGIIRQGEKVLDIQSWDKKDTMETTGRFANMIEKDMLAKIDVIGIGSGVVDRLREQKYKKIVGVNVGHSSHNKERFYKLRDEIFWGLRCRFVDGNIDIPDNRKLIEQLSELRYSFNSRGQLKVEGKEKMKNRGIGSPDEADALALAFYQPPEDDKVSNIYVF
jgi:hypothetical protein